MNAPQRPTKKLTRPKPEEIKKGELHPYWIQYHWHYTQGEKIDWSKNVAQPN